MSEKRAQIQFDDDKLNKSTEFEDSLDDIEDDGGYFNEEEEDTEDDGGYFDEEEEVTEDDDEVNMFEQEDKEDDNTVADDIGVTVNVSELTQDNNENDYEVIGNDTDFIGQNGDFIVMDTNISGDNFKLAYIDIKNIAVVRRIRQSKNVEDLVKSIKSTGLLEPIVVAPTATEGIYVLLAGYRRILACARAGMTIIPSIINTKVNTPEIPIIEAMYNHNKPYNIKEMIDYIDYLEKEKNILSASMIEFLLQMESGDYTKLKDLLDDDDDDIIDKLMSGQMTIGMAFKKLEQRRKQESREEKDYKKASKVYSEEDKTGAEQIQGSGEVSDDGVGLSEEELKSLAIMAENIDEDDGASLEEMMQDSSNKPGFEPKVQTTGERELIDPAMRKAVMERDHNTCMCCKEGGPEYVDVNDFHHIVPVFLGGPDTVDNAACTCVKCHKLIHLHARGQLHLVNIDSMTEVEKKKFKRIIKLGNIIRDGMAAKGMKLDEYKKKDGINQIGRQMPGHKNTVA